MKLTVAFHGLAESELSAASSYYTSARPGSERLSWPRFGGRGCIRSVFGVALGRTDLVLGWVRNIDSVPPSWDAAADPQVTVGVALPTGASEGTWTSTFTDPTSGVETDGTGASATGQLTFVVASLDDAIAFKGHP